MNEYYWYYPKCKMELGWQNVTYEELCDRCGTAVIAVKNVISQERIDKIIEAEKEGR